MPTNTKLKTLTPINKMPDKVLDYWVKWTNGEIKEYQKFLNKIEREQKRRFDKCITK